MTLTDLYRLDLAQQTTVQARKETRLYWYRAVALTITERTLTVIEYPKRRGRRDFVDRWLPFWNRVSDEQLNELYCVLAPYFARPENRHIDLNS